jgi:phospholipase C
LVAPQYFSDHPSAPWFGAWYVSEVLDILTSNPEVWKKTIFILNYDENDGYFDHIPPFVAPKPNDPDTGRVSDGIDTAEEYVTMQEELTRVNEDREDLREGPVGLGYRVPLVIASPWSRGGWVNSQVFDITSTLQFLEKFLTKKTGKEIKESNISDWRRVVSGDLTSVFRPYNGEKIKLPVFLKRDPFVKEIYNAKFKKLPSDFSALTDAEINDIKNNSFSSSLLPKQERGTRDSCSLPYQLYADGKLNANKNAFEITFAAKSEFFGKRSAGAPFNVYAPGKYQLNERQIVDEVKNWNYAVRAGSELKNKWPLKNFENNLYHLRVYGPNGFFREFRGNTNDPDILVEFEYERMKKSQDKLSGNIIISIKNLSEKSHTIYIEDQAYQQGIHTISLNKNDTATETLNLKKSFGWYDFTIKAKGFNLFETRYAGRVETGNHSKSDPFMGRV